jgi:hypothetical protein
MTPPPPARVQATCQTCRDDIVRGLIERACRRWMRSRPGTVSEAALAVLADMLADDIEALGLASALSWRRTAPKDHEAGVRGAWWHKPADWELIIKGKGRASVWLNGTWHTWDAHGIGGENACEATVEDAKREAEAALIRQGWAKAHPARQAQKEPTR